MVTRTTSYFFNKICTLFLIFLVSLLHLLEIRKLYNKYFLGNLAISSLMFLLFNIPTSIATSCTIVTILLKNFIICICRKLKNLDTCI